MKLGKFVTTTAENNSLKNLKMSEVEIWKAAIRE